MINKIRSNVALKLFFILLVVSFIVVISATAYRNNINKAIFQQSIDRNLQLVSFANTESIKQYILSEKNRIVDFSSDGYIRDATEGLLNKNSNYKVSDLNEHLIENKKGVAENILGISILNSSGVTVASTSQKEIGSNQEGEDYFKEVVRTPYAQARFFTRKITNRFSADNQIHPLTVLSAPLKDKDERKDLGVIVIFINQDKFLNLISGINSENVNQQKLNNFTHVYLINNLDQIVAGPKNFLENINNQTIIDYPEYSFCESNFKMEDRYVNLKQENVSGVFTCLPDDKLLIVTENNLDKSFESINRAINESPLTSLVIAFIGMLIYYFFIRNIISKPLNLLIDYADKVSKNDFNLSLHIRSNDEIGKISSNFNHMVLKLRESYRNLQDEIRIKSESLQKSLEDLKVKNEKLQGAQGALLNVFEDIEEEKAKAVKLSEDLKKFQLAVDNSSDGIIMTDPKQKIIYANKAITTITGYDNKFVIGKTPKQLWGEQINEEFYENLLHIVIDQKKPFASEVNNVKKTGEKYIAEEYTAPIINENDEIVFFVIIQRDITKAKEVDKMKTEFISLASHQLRTPLNAIKWYLELLTSEDAGKLNKDQKEYVTEINGSNDRMIELVNSLLNVSRLESGRIIIDPKPTNLVELFDSVIREQQEVVIKKNIKINKSFEEIENINVDPKLIRQVYQNLLSNAIKYGKVDGKIDIYIKKEGDKIVTSVKDDGLGIPEKDQSRIFSKFFRAENVVKLEAEGNGLGLYLVQQIVETSGGKISFKSEEGKGTEFIVELPVKGSKTKKGEVSLS